jgi:hypothetical protein
LRDGSDYDDLYDFDDHVEDEREENLLYKASKDHQKYIEGEIVDQKNNFRLEKVKTIKKRRSSSGKKFVDPEKELKVKI